MVKAMSHIDPHTPQRGGEHSNQAEPGISRPIHLALAPAPAPAPASEAKAKADRSTFPPLKHAISTASTSTPYSSFSPGRKWFIILLISLASIFSPISSNIYVPAIPTLSDAFGVSLEKINLTVTVYLIFQALTPAIWGAAADSFGRRPIYVLNLVIYILSCIGTALCPTSDYWLLMLMRIVQSTGGSATVALGTGVIADIATPQERGKYVGVFQFAGTFSTAIGPVLGGVFAFTLGWRSIFWFLTIFCGAVLVPVIFLLPETLRTLVGDGSIPPPPLNCTPQAYVHRHKEIKRYKVQGEDEALRRLQDQTLHRNQYRPFGSFLLLLEPDLALLFFWSSLGYALWYAVLTIFSTLLKDQYGLSEIIIGVCYIPNGIGTGFSAFITGRLMDIQYRREKKRVGGDHRAFPEEFRLEQVRFMLFPYQAGIAIVSTIALGWSMHAKANLAVPLVLNFFVGAGTSFLTTTTIYAIDLFAGQGGAVTATFNLTRCLMGAGAVAVIQVINRRLGAGWTFVLLSGLWLVFTPLPLIVLWNGPKWRKRRRERIAKKQIRASQAEGAGAAGGGIALVPTSPVDRSSAVTR